MKLGIFLVLLGCCLYLTTARPNDSDFDDDKERSQPATAENSEAEEFDESDSEFEIGSESDDDWIGDAIDDVSKVKKIENEGLDEDQVNKLEKIRRNRIQDHVQGKVHGSIQATDRLMKELRDVYKSASFKNGAYSVELIDDSIYDWNVHLRHIDPDSELYKDLQKLNKTNGQDSIILSFKFKETFPYSAPFVRVVSPVIKGGHIMEGGCICMELLTSDGWSSVYTVEAVIMQISTLLVKGGSRIPEQSKNRAEYDYTVEYAKQAFARIEELHKSRGWGKQDKD